MDILDFVRSNLFVIAIVVSVLFTFLRRAMQTLQGSDSSRPTTPRRERQPTSMPPFELPGELADIFGRSQRDVTKPAEAERPPIQAPRSFAEERQARQASAPQHKRMSYETSLSDVTNLPDEPGAMPTAGLNQNNAGIEIAGFGTTARDVLNGVIWAEIVGKPKARQKRMR